MKSLICNVLTHSWAFIRTDPKGYLASMQHERTSHITFHFQGFNGESSFVVFVFICQGLFRSSSWVKAFLTLQPDFYSSIWLNTLFHICNISKCLLLVLFDWLLWQMSLFKVSLSPIILYITRCFFSFKICSPDEYIVYGYRSHWGPGSDIFILNHYC